MSRLFGADVIIGSSTPGDSQFVLLLIPRRPRGSRRVRASVRFGGLSEKRKVHNAPWSDRPNKNVFSDRLNREYDNSAFRTFDGKLFQIL